MIVRLVQGKSGVFSEIEPVVRTQLVSLQTKYKEELNDLNRAIASGRCDSSINIEYTSQGLNAICAELGNILSTSHVLNEKIKILVERKCYGSKNKTALISEDKDETGTHSLTYSITYSLTYSLTYSQGKPCTVGR